MKEPTNYKLFECPQCQEKVPAVADYIARGLKCPGCGIGFMPVKRETRSLNERRQSKEPMWLVWLVLVLVGVPLIYFFRAEILFVSAVVAAAALGVIAWTMLKKG